MKTSARGGFFSLHYHLHFLPSLIRNRLRRSGGGGTTFAPLEHNIAFVVCCILAVVGIPEAVVHNSLFGWVAGGIGLAGIALLAVQSIRFRPRTPTCDGFLVGVFFFLVVLGFTAGVFAGALAHSFPIGLLGCAAGLAMGYALGILAGFWLQCLGWLVLWLDIAAGLGVIGLIVLNLVLLSG